jgi:hypothetical protein
MAATKSAIYSSKADPKRLEKLLTTTWTLSDTVRACNILRSHILYWSVPHFLKQLHTKRTAGGRKRPVIYADGTAYTVIFHRCNLDDVLDSTEQVALSFRVPHYHYGIEPIVLVSVKKVAQSEPHHIQETA